MLENGEFPNFTDVEIYHTRGINCFAAFDENPKLIKEVLKLDKSLTISDVDTIDDSFDDPIETNPFKILNQTNPFFASATNEFNTSCEINGNLNSTMDKFHKYAAGLNFKKQIYSNSSNSSSLSDDSLDTID